MERSSGSAIDESTVAPSNAEQLRSWDGDGGAYWAAHADYCDRSVAAYHPLLLQAAAINTNDRVLDIGCGTGQTTRDAARAASDASAHGVDLSARMIEEARRRAADEGLENASFEQADVQVHPFEPASFALALSRAGAMFFGDPIAAFTNIAGSLRPAGRLVLLTWQPLAGNEWMREFAVAVSGRRDPPAPAPEGPGPFSLSDPERVRNVLSAAGFTGIELEGKSAGSWFGDDADDGYRFVLGLLGWMLNGLDDAGRLRALDDLRTTLTAHETDHGVVYESAVWLIRATRP